MKQVNFKPYTPNLVNILTRAVGRETMLAFLRAFGGTNIVIPVSFRPDHPACRLLTYRGYRALLKTFHPGARITVPLGPMADKERRRADVQRLVSLGVPNQTIAQQLGCHERTVRRHRQALIEYQSELQKNGGGNRRGPR